MKKSSTSILTLAVVFGVVSMASAGLINYDRKAKRAGQTPPTAVQPVAAKPAASKPAAVEPAAVKPVAAKPAASKPAAVVPVVEEAQTSTVSKPMVPSQPAWAVTPEAVQNELQQKSDMNGDGKLQSFETKIYLRDVMDAANAKGEAPADTDILKAYDVNKNGVIEPAEVVKISEDVEK